MPRMIPDGREPGVPASSGDQYAADGRAAGAGNRLEVVVQDVGSGVVDRHRQRLGVALAVGDEHLDR
jgi:hypothetical protein